MVLCWKKALQSHAHMPVMKLLGKTIVGIPVLRDVLRHEPLLLCLAQVTQTPLQQMTLCRFRAPLLLLRRSTAQQLPCRRAGSMLHVSDAAFGVCSLRSSHPSITPCRKKQRPQRYLVLLSREPQVGSWTKAPNTGYRKPEWHVAAVSEERARRCGVLREAVRRARLLWLLHHRVVHALVPVSGVRGRVCVCVCAPRLVHTACACASCSRHVS